MLMWAAPRVGAGKLGAGAIARIKAGSGKDTAGDVVTLVGPVSREMGRREEHSTGSSKFSGQKYVCWD
jgi:hypothetical protein